MIPDFLFLTALTTEALRAVRNTECEDIRLYFIVGLRKTKVVFKTTVVWE